MSTSLHRRTFFPTEYMFGLDSTQGYLEFAESSQENKAQIVFDNKDEASFLSHLYRLKQLERERLIEVSWSTRKTEDGKEYVSIDQMCLTTSGKEFLEKLRVASKRGRLTNRLKDLVWTILTSIATTLVVLYLKGDA